MKKLNYIGMFTLLVGMASQANAVVTTVGTPTRARVSNLTYTKPITLDFSGALATAGGSFGGTFLTGVSLPVTRTSPVRLALDTGVTFFRSVWLPIYVSVLFDVGNFSESVRPYIGGAVGPLIRISGASINGVAIPDEFQGDSVRLGILLRPGIRVALSEVLDMTAEIPLGGLTGIFYISPTLGIQVKL